MQSTHSRSAYHEIPQPNSTVVSFAASLNGVVLIHGETVLRPPPVVSMSSLDRNQERSFMPLFVHTVSGLLR